MTFNVIVYRITSSFSNASWGADPGDPVVYLANYYIHVRYNDATDTISMVLRDSPVEDGGTNLGDPGAGPNIFGGDGTVEILTEVPFYNFCDGPDLNSVAISSVYPYGAVVITENAAECVIGPACDLAFSSEYTVVNATGPETADGEFTVSATSSNGTVRYSLNQGFNYSDGQLSGNITGRMPGIYTVYAKDPIGCLDEITITVGVTTEYGVRWRGEYDENAGGRSNTRIDILERGYEGEPTEICFGSEPFTLRYNFDSSLESKYKTIISSQAIIELLTEVSEQFIDISLGDDRKYKINFYKGESLDLKWTGFILPENSTEPYLFEPYYTTVTATCGLGDLQNFDFVDESGNNYRGLISVMKVVSEILRKTGLEVNIRNCVNTYEVDMDSELTDDPFSQTFIDPFIFYDNDVPKKCDYVLDALLKSFGASIFQSKGIWWIRRVEDSVGRLTYRDFSSLGVYQTNSTYNGLKEINPPSVSTSFWWRDLSQIIIHDRGYGSFKIVHDLTKDANLLPISSNFEERNIIELGSGNSIFPDWAFFIGQQGVKFGLEFVNNDSSKGAFFIDFNQAFNDDQNDSILSTQFTAVSKGLMVLKFEHSVIPKFKVPYVRIGWQLKKGSEYFYVNSTGIALTTSVEYINDVYVSSYNTFGSFELPINLGNTSGDLEDFEFKIFAHNHKGRDFDDYDDLRDGVVAGDGVTIIPADDLNVGHKIYFNNGSETLLYELQFNTSAESVPDIIRPVDFGSMPQPKQWILKETISLTGSEGLVNKILIDNCQIEYYPINPQTARNYDPPETVTYSSLVQTFLKPVYTAPVLFGDLPIMDNANLVYNSFFRLSDNTPTYNWFRRGISESVPLLQMLLTDYKSQLVLQRKIRGTGLTDTFIDYADYLRDNYDERKYMIGLYELTDKSSSYTVELFQIAVGGNNEPPPQSGAYDPEPYNNTSYDI
jgi:hypothetical protein